MREHFLTGFNLLSEILFVQAWACSLSDSVIVMFQSLERDSVCSSHAPFFFWKQVGSSFNLLSEILFVQAPAGGWH